MFKKVSKLFLEKSAGVSLLCAGLLALSVIVAGPSAATAAPSAAITTNHWKNGSSEGYTLKVTVTDSLASLMDATLSNGAVPLDPNALGTSFSASIDLASSRPLVGESYAVDITYNDGTPDTLYAPVTDVLDAFATPTAPLGAVASSSSPVFKWTPPAILPNGTYGFSGYLLSLYGNLADFQWNSLKLATGTTAALYTRSSADTANGLPAAPTPGIPYDWSISMLDSQGNSSENRGASFMIGTNFSGVVTGLNGAPIAGATIYVYDANNNVQTNTGTTLSDGSYLYGGLATGSYKVWFRNAPAGAYYSNKLQSNQADLLALTSGVMTTGVNAVLGGWGSISGNVVNSSRTSFAGARVDLYDTNFVLTSVPGATTKADGSFVLGLIPPGNYKLKFSAPGYADVWYGTTVNVSADVATTLSSDAVLNKLNISGKVTNGSGAALPGIWIYLYDALDNFAPNFYGVQTLADGSYTIGGIAAGSYKVQFDSKGAYAKQYYNGKPTAALAELVTVPATTPVTNINAVLSSGIPTVTSFTVPATSTSLTVSGISIAATETNGVAGYLLTESPSAPSAGDAGWSASTPTSYTFASAGARTLYAWAKGTTDKVSLSRNAIVTITLPVNGTCGTSSGGAFILAPTTNLCATGTASSITGPGPWVWTCSSTDGGSAEICNASVSLTETFPIPLTLGWNMISLPLQPSPTDVGTVLGALTYRNVWGYIGGGNWQMYDPTNPDFSDLTTVNSGAGYWIYATGPATLEVVGTIAPKGMQLASGWNLVGYNGTVTQGVIQATDSIGADLDTMWGFNAGVWQLYDPSNPDFSDLATLVPGKGYWIKMKQAGTWTLP